MVTRSEHNWMRRQFDALRQRIGGVVSRAGISTPPINPLDPRPAVTAGLLADEERGGVEVFQPQGVDDSPLPGDEAIALAVGGDRDHIVLIVHGSPGTRPEGKLPGETDFHGRFGQKIRMHADGSITLTPGPTGSIGLGGDTPALGGAGKALARTEDPVTTSAAFDTWQAAVSAAVPVTPMAGTLIGIVQGSSQKVTAE